MKKIIILWTLITSFTVSFAHSEGTEEQQAQFKKQVMQMQDKFMNELSSKVDEKTVEKLNEMKMKHREEMKKMMISHKSWEISEEKMMEIRMEMKKRHFADLKNALEKYPKLYEEYSKKMEEIMANIQKMRKEMSWKNNMGQWMNNWMGMNWMQNNPQSKIITNPKIEKWQKIREASWKIQAKVPKYYVYKIDSIAKKVAKKFMNLDETIRNKKIENLKKKVEIAKQKINKINKFSTARKQMYNNVLDFLIISIEKHVASYEAWFVK